MVKPPCERECPRRTVGCHAECASYLEYEEAKQEEYRANQAERDRNAYTADAEKRRKRVERLQKLGRLK